MTPTPGASSRHRRLRLAPSWDTTISAIFNAKCAACHINAVMGDLSLKTYADALKGGKSGPAIVPNDPDKSVLVQVQQKGGHPGQLSADELAQVIAWIEAGAPEKVWRSHTATDNVNYGRLDGRHRSTGQCQVRDVPYQSQSWAACRSRLMPMR